MRTSLTKSSATTAVAVGLLGMLTAITAAPANAAVALPTRASFGLDSANWKSPKKSGVTPAMIDKVYCTIGTTCPVRAWSKSISGEFVGVTVIAAGRTSSAANANRRAAQVVVETKATFADQKLPPLIWKHGKTDGIAWQLGNLNTKAEIGGKVETMRVRALVAVRSNRLMTVFMMQITPYAASPQPMIQAVARSLKGNGTLPLVKGPVRGLVSVKK